MTDHPIFDQTIASGDYGLVLQALTDFDINEKFEKATEKYRPPTWPLPLWLTELLGTYDEESEA